MHDFLSQDLHVHVGRLSLKSPLLHRLCKSGTATRRQFYRPGKRPSEYSVHTVAMRKTSQGCGAARRTDVSEHLPTFICWCGHMCAPRHLFMSGALIHHQVTEILCKNREISYS